MNAIRAIRAAILAAILLSGCAGVYPPRHTDEDFARIHREMTKDEVTSALGPPNETMKFPATHTESYDYLYTDTWGFNTRYSIVFDESGRVVDTVAVRLNDGGGRKGRR